MNPDQLPHLPEAIVFDPAKIAAAEEDERKRIYRLHWLESRVPPAFEKAQPDHMRAFLDFPAVRLVRETIRSWKDNRTEPEKIERKPLLIGICGSPGTGKTTLGVELLRLGAQNYATVRYVGMEHMCRIIECRSEHWSDLDEEWLAPRMLVIDDVFLAELPSQRRALSSLIIDRCNALKWTVVIATCDPAAFGNILGPQVADRLSAGPLILTGPSHRTFA